MKKICVLIILIMLYITFSNIIVNGEEINLNLSKDEIAITFVNYDLLITNTENNFISLTNKSKDIKLFGKYNNININSIKDTNIDFINYKKEDNITRIKYKDYTFCIYNKDTKDISNIYNCNFLYLFDTLNINSIDVDNIDVIFFDENAKIPDYFIEDLYSKWIDIYKLNSLEYVVLKINSEDYKIIVIPK